jgi:hypothetical protein
MSPVLNGPKATFLVPPPWASHHPRPVEVYRGKLVLYGCGDCIDDYEGISGHEQFRDDLRLLYFASLAPDTGALESLRMVPMQARRMRLGHASTTDSQWLAATLNRVSHRFGSRLECQPDGMIRLRHCSGAQPNRRLRSGHRANRLMLELVSE